MPTPRPLWLLLALTLAAGSQDDTCSSSDDIELAAPASRLKVERKPNENKQKSQFDIKCGAKTERAALEPSRKRKRGSGGVPLRCVKSALLLSAPPRVVSASPAGDRGPHGRIRSAQQANAFRIVWRASLCFTTITRPGSLPSTGSSGFAGVSWHKPTFKWLARLQHGGTQHHLGRFAEERDAAAVVQAAREAAAEGRLGEHLTKRREAAARERASGQWRLQCI